MRHTYKLPQRINALSRVDCEYWRSLNPGAGYLPNPVCFDVPEIIPDDPKAPSILWIGRFDQKEKRYKDLVKIMKIVVKARPDAVLTVVGDGETKKEMIGLRRLIEKNKLQDNIILAGYQTNVYSFYQEASIYISTSLCEGFPTTLVESKAFGVPCVAYELPYLEMHREREGIITVPFPDEIAMASEIIKLLNDDELRKDMRQQARNGLSKYVNWDHEGEWKAIFEKVCLPEIVSPYEPDIETVNILWETQYMYELVGVKYHRISAIEVKNLKKEIKRLDREWHKLQAEILRLSNKNTHLVDNNKSLHGKVAWLRAKKNQIAKDNEALKKAVKKHRQSKSWKIGRVLTWLPRKLKRS
jgi:hypothetical protein